MNSSRTVFFRKLKQEVVSTNFYVSLSNFFLIDDKTVLTNQGKISIGFIKGIFKILFGHNFFFVRDYVKGNIYGILRRVSNFLKLTSKGYNQVFFMEFRILGLGYKGFLYRLSLDDKVICFRLGISHRLKYMVPSNVNFVSSKKRFIIYSNDWQTLNLVSKHFLVFRRANIYKAKGILDVNKELKYKQTKQQKK